MAESCLTTKTRRFNSCFLLRAVLCSHQPSRLPSASCVNQNKSKIKTTSKSQKTKSKILKTFKFQSCFHLHFLLACGAFFRFWPSVVFHFSISAFSARLHLFSLHFPFVCGAFSFFCVVFRRSFSFCVVFFFSARFCGMRKAWHHGIRASVVCGGLVPSLLSSQVRELCNSNSTMLWF